MQFNSIVKSERGMQRGETRETGPKLKGALRAADFYLYAYTGLIREINIDSGATRREIFPGIKFLRMQKKKNIAQKIY